MAHANAAGNLIKQPKSDQAYAYSLTYIEYDYRTYKIQDSTYKKSPTDECIKKRFQYPPIETSKYEIRYLWYFSRNFLRSETWGYNPIRFRSLKHGLGEIYRWE
jgi:hypothetical protein